MNNFNDPNALQAEIQRLQNMLNSNQSSRSDFENFQQQMNFQNPNQHYHQSTFPNIMPPPPATSDNKVAFGSLTQKDIMSFIISVLIAVGGVFTSINKTVNDVERQGIALDKVEKTLKQFESEGFPKLNSVERNNIYQEFRNHVNNERTEVENQIRILQNQITELNASSTQNRIMSDAQLKNVNDSLVTITARLQVLEAANRKLELDFARFESNKKQ